MARSQQATLATWHPSDADPWCFSRILHQWKRGDGLVMIGLCSRCSTLVKQSWKKKHHVQLQLVYGFRPDQLDFRKQSWLGRLEGASLAKSSWMSKGQRNFRVDFNFHIESSSGIFFRMSLTAQQGQELDGNDRNMTTSMLRSKGKTT